MKYQVPKVASFSGVQNRPLQHDYSARIYKQETVVHFSGFSGRYELRDALWRDSFGEVILESRKVIYCSVMFDCGRDLASKGERFIHP